MSWRGNCLIFAVALWLRGPNELVAVYSDGVIVRWDPGRHARLGQVSGACHCQAAVTAAAAGSAPRSTTNDPRKAARPQMGAMVKGLVSQVGYHYRFVGAFQEVKRLLDAGAIVPTSLMCMGAG